MAQFQVDGSRQALRPLIGDPINANNRPRVQKGSRWENAKALVCPDKLGAAGIVAAFKNHCKPQQHTSNSKYFVLRSDKWESHEDAELAAVLQTPAVQALIGREGSKDNTSAPQRRRRRHGAPVDKNYGLRTDAIEARVHKLDRQTAARHRVMSPTSVIRAPGDPLVPRKSRPGTGRETCDGTASVHAGQGHQRTTETGDSGRSRGPMRRNKSQREARNGDTTEAALSDGAESDDGGWLREEDAIYLPSDAELDAMPVGKALNALLNAQQRVICGLGRVEEPWDVRLQRKQAAMKAAHPNKPPRVALFDTSSTASTEHTAYAMQRHTYLVSKIVDLRRKQKAIAFRQDQQLGAVADRVEVEKRHMLMQLFDLSREERRLRMLMRRMDDKANTSKPKSSATEPSG